MWSYEENAPAQRYQLIRDVGDGLIRLFSGGYSPKVDDQSWCKIMADQLEEKLSGANIVGDGHYTWARKWLTQVHFYAPTRSRAASNNGTDLQESEGLSQLTQAQKTENAALTKVRNVVESPFGVTKTQFKSLGLSSNAISCIWRWEFTITM